MCFEKRLNHFENESIFFFCSFCSKKKLILGETHRPQSLWTRLPCLSWSQLQKLTQTIRGIFVTGTLLALQSQNIVEQCSLKTRFSTAVSKIVKHYGLKSWLSTAVLNQGSFFFKPSTIFDSLSMTFDSNFSNFWNTIYAVFAYSCRVSCLILNSAHFKKTLRTTTSCFTNSYFFRIIFGAKNSNLQLTSLGAVFTNLFRIILKVGVP